MGHRYYFMASYIGRQSIQIEVLTMKKFNIIAGLALCLFNMNFIFAQEIFMDNTSGKEYLFLGSIGENQKKWLDLKTNTIEWIENSKLKQSGQLTPEEFFEKTIKNNLVFKAEGGEPYWNATLSRSRLKISLPEDKTQEVVINTSIDNKPLDNVFLLMFQSKDHQTYGLIRKLWWDNACEVSITDEISTYEVFINHKGKIIKGCARLDKA